MNRLISFPRSGNHWVRFIIEFLSNRPTLYGPNEDDGPIYKNAFYFNNVKVPCPIYIKNKDPIFFKQHDTRGYPEINDDDKIGYPTGIYAKHPFIDDLKIPVFFYKLCLTRLW